MKLVLRLLIAIALCSQPINSFAQKTHINIIDYGATANDEQNDQTAIQKAIEACHQQGGGEIIIPAGKYITGTLLFKSNINFYLAAGAKLVGSDNLSDYEIEGVRHGMIYGENLTNISITGPGEINGNGSIFFSPGERHFSYDYDKKYIRQGEAYLNPDDGAPDGPIAYEDRPGMLMVFFNCENIQLKDITITDTPSWAVRFGECDNIVADNVTILNNLLIPNSDGIHCTTSRNVRISNCDIRAGDDALIITGFGNKVGVGGGEDENALGNRMGNKTGFAENVTVSNCVLQSRSSGIRIGYGENPIRNCVFQNIVIYESNRGIGVFARNNAPIENILFDNITIQNRIHAGWWGSGEPLHVSAIAQRKNVPAGTIRNVRFSNIVANSETGLVVYGQEEGLIKDLIFENIDLTISNGKYSASYGGNFDLRPVAEKRFAIFKHDIPAFFGSYVDQLQIKNFKVNWGTNLEKYFTHAIALHHCKKINIDGFEGKQAPVNTLSTIYLSEANQVAIKNCVAAPGTTVFVNCENLENAGIFSGNDLVHAQKIFADDSQKFFSYGNKIKQK